MKKIKLTHLVRSKVFHIAQQILLNEQKRNLNAMAKIWKKEMDALRAHIFVRPQSHFKTSAKKALKIYIEEVEKMEVTFGIK